MEHETRTSKHFRPARQQGRTKTQDRKPRSRVLPWRKGRQPLHRHRGLHFQSYPMVRWSGLHGTRDWPEAPQDRLTRRVLMRHDLNEVAALLQIHEKAMGHPRLKPLADAAMKALEDMAEETAKPQAEPEPEPTEEVAIDNGKENPATTIERKL